MLLSFNNPLKIYKIKVGQVFSFVLVDFTASTKIFKLTYIIYKIKFLELVMGLGPMTFRLRIECTTNCATPANFLNILY